jgi:hypothetical protein
MARYLRQSVRRRQTQVRETHLGGPAVLRMIVRAAGEAGMSYDRTPEAVYSSFSPIRPIQRAEVALKPLTVKPRASGPKTFPDGT